MSKGLNSWESSRPVEQPGVLVLGSLIFFVLCGVARAEGARFAEEAAGG